MAVDIANADSTTTKDDSITRVRPSDSIMKLNSIDKNNIDKKTRIKHRFRFMTFILIMIFNVFINYDVGAVPVMLNWIQEPYNFKNTELGIMGALLYVGTSSFAPLWPYVISNFSSKKSLIIAYITIVVSMVIFGLSVNKYMFFVSKFIKGASQGAYAFFYPIWVDKFAPKEHRNLWISIIQSGLIIGVTVGYVTTSICSFAGEYGWRYSILIQSIGLAVLIISFSIIPKGFIEINRFKENEIDFDVCTCEQQDHGSSRASGGSNLYLGETRDLGKNGSMKNAKCSKCHPNVKSYDNDLQMSRLSSWSKIKILFKHTNFILLCLTLSSVYLVLFGAQFWMTKIVVSHFKINERKAFFTFSFIFMASQFSGLLIGSHIIDRVTVNYPQNPLLVDYVILIWYCIVNAVTIVMFIFPTVMTLFIGNMILFFYGSPTGPVILLKSVNSVPDWLKTNATSFIVAQVNILGFIAGTLLPGIGVDLFKSDLAGFYIVYIPCFITTALLLIRCILLRNKAKSEKANIS